jgi:hypothetical protein
MEVTDVFFQKLYELPFLAVEVGRYCLSKISFYRSNSFLSIFIGYRIVHLVLRDFCGVHLKDSVMCGRDKLLLICIAIVFLGVVVFLDVLR